MTEPETKARTVFVTGSSRGIGRAIAERFALAGHRVVLHGKTESEALNECFSRLKARGCSVMKVTADVSDGTEMLEAVRSVQAYFGSVEILINNAGEALPQQLLTDCAEGEIRRMLDVNALGAMLVSRAVIPGMVSKKEGSIVNLSSYFGIVGGSCEVPYSASKAALIGFTRALAKELAPSGIRVNCVAPGFVDTDMNAHFSEADRALIREDIPLGRFGTPEDIAEAVYFLARSETAGFLTGQTLTADGGASL